MVRGAVRRLPWPHFFGVLTCESKVSKGKN
jgi:hypothetical protein